MKHESGDSIAPRRLTDLRRYEQRGLGRLSKTGRKMAALATIGLGIVASDAAEAAYHFQTVTQQAEAATQSFPPLRPNRQPKIGEILILNWNILGGVDLAGEKNVDQVDKLLKTTQPDVVILTETMERDVSQLRKALPGHYVVFDPAETRPDIQFGKRLFDTEPLTKGNLVMLPPELVGQRFEIDSIALERGSNSFAARTATLITTDHLQMLVTHLEAKNSIVREVQAKQVVDFIHEKRVADLPLYAAGDFNAGLDSNTLTIFGELGLKSVDCGRTLADSDSDAQSDHVLFPPEAFGNCTTELTTSSDHLLSIVTIDFTKRL